MKNTFYTLLIVLLAVMNLQAQEGQHVVQVPTPDEGVVVGAIGGTVDVSALGGATYTIPIQVPEGLGGVQPNLSITYNSQSGNGLLGWGWNLGGLSAITRVGRTLYHDGEVCGAGLNYMDRYALDGQRLILIEGEYGGYGAEYKTEVDGMSRIVSHTEDRFVDGPAYFKVYTPEGLTLYYGWDRSGDDNARIVWEHDGKKIVVLWLLKRVEDQNGNYMVYNYCIGGHDYRLDNIQYCANPAARNEPDNERGTKYGVDFKYSHRDDYETSFIGDYVLHQPWLLENISVHYWENNTRLFDYTFEYDEVSGQMNSEYFYNRLKNIKFETADGNGYNETTIDWGNNPNINNGNFNIHNAYVSYIIPIGLNNYANQQKFSGDFNGDGLSDFISVYNDSKQDITYAQVFLNKGNTKSTQSPGNVMFEKRGRLLSFKNYQLCWIYVCDFNGDGLDDFYFMSESKHNFLYKQSHIYACESYYDEENNWSYRMVKFYNGSDCDYYSTNIGNQQHVMILTGDFMGRGKTDVVFQIPTFIIEEPFGYFEYQNGKIMVNWADFNHSNCQLRGENYVCGDFDCDGKTEIWLNGIAYSIKRLWQYYYTLEVVEVNAPGYGSVAYVGDFNGDGCADFLSYNEQQTENCWKIHIGHKTNAASRFYYNIASIMNSCTGSIAPYYGHLLETQGNMSYYMEITDMNGDGKSDIVIIGIDHIHILYGPIYKRTSKDGSEYGDFAYHEIIDACNTGIGNNQFGSNISTRCVGNFLGQDNQSIIDEVVFSKPQHSTYYNVESITDGMGNQTRFEYGYLVHNPHPDMEEKNIYTIDHIGENLSFDIYNKPLPIRAVRAIETENINVEGFLPSRSEYHFSNAMVHKTGHGFLGFKAITQINGLVEPITTKDGILRKRGKTERIFSFKPMGEHCTLTPESERAFRFKSGENDPILVSETQYQYVKFLCELDKSGKVFAPAATQTKTRNYELLGERSLLRVKINDIEYNGETGFGPFNYTLLVHPTQSWQGTDAADSHSIAADCDFVTHSKTEYMGIAEPWVINRPKKVFTESLRRTPGYADSRLMTEYTYLSSLPHLVKTISNYPYGNESNTNSLATRTTCKYNDKKMLVKETQEAINDTELEPRVTIYDYSDDLRFQTVEDKQDGYVTNYSYDEVWGELQWTDDCNGFRTITENPDHLGITNYMYDADNTNGHNRINGTESATALRWILNSGYADYANGLDNASYFSWEKAEGSAEAFTIFDAAGRELRKVTRGLTEDVVIYQDTEYDSWGRVLQVSEPYFRGGDPRWTKYYYDDFDRTSKIEPPTYVIVNEDGQPETWQPYTAIEYSDSNNDQLVTVTKTGATHGTIDRFHQSESKVNIMGWTDWNKEYLDESLETYNLTDYGYNADGSLAWTKVNEQDFTKVEMGYDDAGNRTTLSDPDYGTTTTRYDAFGQLIYQETPKGDYTEYEYDRHGRQTTRIETTISSGTSETTTWTYKEDQGQRGLLESIDLDGRQTITNTYDAQNYNRLRNVEERIDNDSYTTSYAYDDDYFPLRAKEITYPTGFIVSKEYDQNTGKLIAIKHNDKDIWHTDKANALGQITKFTYGNGVVSTYDFDSRHFLSGQLARKNDQIIQEFGYTYDIFANLAARTDNKHGMTESFTYDYLNRLETITLNNGIGRGMEYDDLGRITSKQDVFSDAVYYDSDKPHAIREATLTGNPFAKPLQNIQYTMFDKVARLRVQEKQMLYYQYGFDHQRTKMREMDLNFPVITCEKTYVGNCEYWGSSMFGPAKSLTYLAGPMGVFAVAENSGDEFGIHYIHKDHLGSWTTITDENSEIEQEASFDAWGNIRSASDWTSPLGDKLLFDRGFTGHEHLFFYEREFHFNPSTDLTLINMNGRMYDPVMSSFLSVDNYVQSPENSQNFNRYAYCLNNPLKYTDPSGEFFTWSIGTGGFSFGLNFTPAGIPLGFGVNVSWANGGSFGVYGEVAYRVGGTGLGAGGGVQQSFDLGFTSGFSSSTSAFGYASLGCFTAGGSVGRNWPNKANFWGVNVGVGFGRSDGNLGGGLSISYGSGGWSFGANGYYNKMQKAYDRIISTASVDESENIPAVGQEGDHGCITAVYEWITATYGIELTPELKAEIAGCVVVDKQGNWFLKSGNRFMNVIETGHIAQGKPYPADLMSTIYEQIEQGSRIAVNLGPINENVGMYNSYVIDDGHSVAIQSISKTEHINIFGKVSSHGYSITIMDPAMKGYYGGYRHIEPYYIHNSLGLSIFYRVH